MKEYIVEQVNIFIEEYKEMKDLFNDITSIDFTNTIINLFDEKKVSKEHEEEIYKRIFNSVNLKPEIRENVLTDGSNLQNILAKYGQETGLFLLSCNKLISTICKNQSEKFDKRINKKKTK